MNIKDYLNEHILLFDGGMGTYFAQLNHANGAGCELANLSQPNLIAQIHREYLDAGCDAIKTNTFSANRLTYQGDDELTERVIAAGYQLAAQAAAERDGQVFADIGPISMLSEDVDPTEEYRFVADCFLRLGAKNFLFETNADTVGLKEAALYIKEQQPDSFILVSFALQPDGYTREGRFAADLMEEMKACPAIDALGLNCLCGARHMLELIRDLDHADYCLSLMPNAGYPYVINNRTFYEGDPAYFASQLAEMAAEGARILGGCCGTTPEHIRQAALALSQIPQRAAVDQPRRKTAARSALSESPFWEKLQKGQKVIAVELDPPADVDLHRFMRGAWELRGKNVDIITIADCPIARARMDSTLLACKLHRELQMDALPHMTCRDRNLNATKALLMGAYAEGIRNVLLVTGDPIPTAERDEVKSVFQFNSRKLAAFASGLSRSAFPTPLHLFGALNVNAANFDVQLRLAKEKQEKGMVGFLTQPILTSQAFENLKKAREELNGYLLGGIIPVVSARNARFMDSEINGIRVDPQLIPLYEGKSRSECEALAVEISGRIAKEIAPYVDGYYFMTPFGRTGLICDIIDTI